MTRKLVAALFTSVDGIVSAPNEFQLDSFDDDLGAFMGQSIGAVDDVILGRVSYTEWAGYFPTSNDPFADFINPVNKHVASRTLTQADLAWNNSTLIDGDRPVLGVVYAPAMDLLFYAAQGQGAFRQLAGRPAEKIRARQFDPTQITVAGSRSHGDDRLHAFLDRIGPHMLISMGSSLKICLIAEGRADVYPRLGPTSEWDTAAAQCVLEEAGGTIKGTDGQVLRYNTKDSLLNPEFFAIGPDSRDWSKYLD